jgi:hypothetical protein
MKLDLNFELKNLEGQPIEGANVGKLLANTLVTETKGDALKYWDWATKLNNGKVLDIDLSDAEVLKNFIKQHEGFTVLLKAQILPLFK